MDAEETEVLASSIPDWFLEYGNLENHWENGVHIDKEGNTHRITKMSDRHLINTINYFKKNLNVKLLVEELKKRKLLTNNK